VFYEKESKRGRYVGGSRSVIEEKEKRGQKSHGEKN
jgi:hypothetical protein